MTALYVDTSALGRVLLREAGEAAIMETLRGYDERISSQLLRVELRRLAARHGLLAEATELLGTISLLALTGELLAAAEVVPPSSVGTLDAIHLATATQLAADGLLDAILTFDRSLAAGARHHGLEVLSPA